jgi:hypothetical protein
MAALQATFYSGKSVWLSLLAATHKAAVPAGQYKNPNWLKKRPGIHAAYFMGEYTI